MALDTPHPLYAKFVPDWRQMRDSFEGERRVKEAGFRYLPPTKAMVMDGAVGVNRGHSSTTSDGQSVNTTSLGWQAYSAYRMRARYPDFVNESVTYLLGVMHREPPTIELPAKMEYLRDRATLSGESLEQFLRRVNEQQLVTGRVGIMGDVLGPEAGPDAENAAYLALYRAENIINWDQGLREGVEFKRTTLVVLDESRQERQPDFSWREVQRFRVLSIGDPASDGSDVEDGSGVYQSGEFSDTVQFSPAGMIEPSFRGQKLDEIPFVFVNGCDVVAEPDKPPLLGLSALALAIYRGEADYRQTLFAIGQDTLVRIGVVDDDQETRIGAGAVIDLPMGGDAKFIGINSQGLPEQRMSLENDYRRAREMAGQLLDSTSNERESGEALRVRVGVRTATVKRVAMAGAEGLQRILRKLAKWIGANPDEVVVTPNLDFVDDRMAGRELSEFMGAKMLGAPLAIETIHAQMRERGLTDKSFEEELAQIEAERALGIGGEGSTNPDGPDPDEDEDDEGDEDGRAAA